MNTPLDLDSFVAIVESGSISEAARALGEPRATLSRRLARLEEHFGVRLLHRSTRRLEPTRVGLELYQRGRRIVDEVRAVGFVDDDGRRLTISDRGRMFVRNVCMAFDRYLEAKMAGEKPVFSRTV